MKNQHFIPSIYNYCDRWCERCSKSNQCRVYADELENPLPVVELDLQSNAFWERMTNNLDDAIGMINQMAEEMGINIEELEPDLPPVIHQRFAALIKETVTYGLEVNIWLNDFRHHMADSFNIIETRNSDRDSEILNAYETVRWYSLQIGVKIKRASARFEQDDHETFKDDQDGSAKVALISLEGSINAFAKILKNFPLYEDSILVFLAKLAIIKQEVNHLFPEAESFKRPGFDC